MCAQGMKESWSTPHLMHLAGGAQELVVSVKDNIIGFDPKSGQELWRCAGIPDYVCPSVISQDGIAYVIGGRSSMAIAVRGGGRGDVTDTHKLWEAKAGANVTSPIIHDGHMYWVSDRNKVAYCLRLSDGQILYSERFPDQPYASATAGDGKIYIVTRNGGTYVLAAKPEYNQLAHNKLQDNSTFNASPAISQGQLLLLQRPIFVLRWQALNSGFDAPWRISPILAGLKKNQLIAIWILEACFAP